MQNVMNTSSIMIAQVHRATDSAKPWEDDWWKLSGLLPLLQLSTIQEWLNLMLPHNWTLPHTKKKNLPHKLIGGSTNHNRQQSSGQITA
jgi:hypothetical protein